MTITDLAVTTHILIVAVTDLAVHTQMQLEIPHARLYTITIPYVQGCVAKVVVIGIRSLMIIPDQSWRANEMCDFSDNQSFLFSFRKYVVRVSILIRYFKSNSELH